MSYADPLWVNPCPDLSADEYAELRAKIERQGFLSAYPIIRSAGPARPGEIVDGFHRTKICAELGIEPVVALVPFESDEEFRLEQIDSNLTRRQLSRDQRIRLVLARSSLVATVVAAAEARRRVGRPSAELPANLPEGGPSRTERETREQLGKLAGVSGRTFEKHVAVIDSGDEFLNAELAADRMSTDMAYRKLMEQRDVSLSSEAEAEAELAEHTPPRPPQPDMVRERHTGEACRRVMDLVKYLRAHPVSDQDVLDYRSKPHTLAGAMRELADWSDLTASALELNQ